ncbi:TRAP transporter small permease [Oricola nitratireducens]|uniref:TRAP transporter small permease n=1 Tax=Oricola nitratireducens TaxID=2775868 RepID=UPI00186797DC|nr:TRAP transporter small permease [Oricola nitratireducens]
MGKSAAYRDIKADDGGSKGPLGHLGSAVEWVLGLVLIGVVLINVVNATGRYLFSASMTGADELMVFIMIFVVMVGAVLALAGRRHICVNLLPSYATGRRLHFLYVVHDLIGLAATSYAFHASWLFVSKIARLGTKSMTLGIPMTIPHSALLIGFGAMAVISFVCLIRDLFLLAGAPASDARRGDSA